MPTFFDTSLREAAFAFLSQVQARTGGPIRHEDVSDFEFNGQRVALMDKQRGIRKPRVLSAALSFRTVHAANPNERPYDDAPGPDGYLRYKWRGTDPQHPENVALRAAQIESLPLIWFQGVASGLYLPIYPVYLTEEEPELHQFVVALGIEQLNDWRTSAPRELQLHRRYATRIVDERLHQPVFRARVLAAYETHCAICRFRHHELLDAAHIRPERHGGEPVVTNGIALCKTHHAAFDSNFLGIDPDYRVKIRADLLAETDGPTLKYLLQDLQNSRISVPRQRSHHPDRDLLAERFEQFKKAA